MRRCHPDIAAVPNAQFYGGRLIDGCSREQRASLLPGLPSLVFLDVRGQEQYGAGAAGQSYVCTGLLGVRTQHRQLLQRAGG